MLIASKLIHVNIQEKQRLINKKAKQLFCSKGGINQQHLELKVKLNSYKTLKEHDPQIISLITKTFKEEGALERRKKTSIRFNFSVKKLEFVIYLHKILSRNGYCNPRPLEIRKEKNYAYFRFSTYAFESFNAFYGIVQYNSSGRKIKNIEHFELDFKTSVHQKVLFAEHSSEIQSILIGSMLGDGHARKQNQSSNTQISFVYTALNPEYPQWFHKKLSALGYCSKKLVQISKIGDKKNQIYCYYRFKTYAFRSLNELHSMFYRELTKEEKKLYRKAEKKIPLFFKIIPTNIADFLTPLAIAIWYQDDGNLHKEKGYIRFCTNGFFKADIELLQKALENKFDIKNSLQKAGRNLLTNEQQYMIYVSRKESLKLINIIKPFVVSSMFYKIDLKS